MDLDVLQVPRCQFGVQQLVCIGGFIGIVLHLADHNGPDPRIPVVGPQREGLHRRQPTRGIRNATEGLSVKGRAEMDIIHKGRQFAFGVGDREPHIIAVGAAEGKAERIFRIGIEVRFVQHKVLARTQDGPARNTILQQLSTGVTQVPVSQVDRLAGHIQQFDRVSFLDRGIGVAEHFVDHDANGRRAGASGRSTELGAASPAEVLAVGVSRCKGRVDQLQGSSVAVGPLGPQRAVIVGKINQDLARSIQQFAGVRRYCSSCRRRTHQALGYRFRTAAGRPGMSLTTTPCSPGSITVLGNVKSKPSNSAPTRSNVEAPTF